MRWILVPAFLFVAFIIGFASAPQAFGCAFTVSPTTYEPPANRARHLTAMEMAGHNMISPNSTFFGIPNVETGTRGNRTMDSDPYVPPTLLKAIGWIESSIAQSDWNTPFGAVGPVLQSFDCGFGIMQITSGMTSALDGGWPSKQQSLVATHYLYNVGRGSAILVDKWNAAPQSRPIAGTDSGSDPRIVENWYYATWSYNGFTGPGANRSNHPSTPSYAWPRTGFSCGPLNDGYGHSYGDYPYQELVFGCAARPPSVGGQLWSPLNLSLPNLENPTWGEPLSLETWNTCVRAQSGCSNWQLMDLPTIQTPHTDPAPRPGAAAVSAARGDPVLSVSRTSVTGLDNTITISNVGSGVLAWRVDHPQNWLGVNKQAGVALGTDVPCSQGSPCQRNATLRITVSPSQAPQDGSFGWVNIISLTTNQLWQVGVIPSSSTAPPPPPPTNTSPPPPTNTPRPAPSATPETIAGDANCNSAVDSIDASLILQFGAGLIPSISCPGSGDVNGDGTINVLDATLILQFVGGFIGGLPP